jgi:hypothetical protein
LAKATRMKIMASDSPDMNWRKSEGAMLNRCVLLWCYYLHWCDDGATIFTFTHFLMRFSLWNEGSYVPGLSATNNPIPDRNRNRTGLLPVPPKQCRNRSTVPSSKYYLFEYIQFSSWISR